MPETVADQRRARDEARRQKVGEAADAAAESTIGTGDLGAAAGDDPFIPKMSDFPRPPGLSGAAEQNKAYRIGLEQYRTNPGFKAEWIKARQKAVGSVQGDAAATANRSAFK